MREKDEFILFCQIVLGKIASAARNLIYFPSNPNRSHDLCLFSCLYPSSMTGRQKQGKKGRERERRSIAENWGGESTTTGRQPAVRLPIPTDLQGTRLITHLPPPPKLVLIVGTNLLRGSTILLAYTTRRLQS